MSQLKNDINLLCTYLLPDIRSALKMAFACGCYDPMLVVLSDDDSDDIEVSWLVRADLAKDVRDSGLYSESELYTLFEKPCTTGFWINVGSVYQVITLDLQGEDA